MSANYQSIKILDIKIGKRGRVILSGSEEESLEVLKESLTREGLINPITVLKIDDPNYQYELIAGERRLTAATELGWAEINAFVYETLDDFKKLSIELFENLARKQMTWQEEVKLKYDIHELMKSRAKGKWTHEDTAAMLEASRATVTKDLKLAEAIIAMPSIARAKSKREAMRALDKLAITMQKEEIAETILNKEPLTLNDEQINLIASTYKVGDYFELMKTIPDGSVDYIDFDPPWGIGGDAKHDNLKRVFADDLEEAMGGDFNLFYNQGLKLALKKLKKSGWITIWFGIEHYQKVVEILNSIPKLKFNLIPALWYKGNGQTNAPHLYMKSTVEFFIYATYNGFLHVEGRNNVFDVSVDYGNAKRHPNQKPIKLCSDLLDVFAFKGAFVISAFAGSGNMLLTAWTKNMKAVGFDLNKDYKNSFVVAVSELLKSGKVQQEQEPDEDD